MFNLNLNGTKTQSKSHIKSLDSSSYLKSNQIKNLFGYRTLLKYKNLIERMIQKEEDYATTHYVFYHGINNLVYTIQDIIKSLYACSENINPKDLSNFNPIRIPGDKTYSKLTDVNKFLNYVISLNREVSDFDFEIAKYILPVNIALFGNSSEHFLSESAFHAFINNLKPKHAINLDKLIIDVFKYFNILPTANNIEKIHNLANIINKEGGILQIFIPKSDVNKYAYLARDTGQPYGTPKALGILSDRTKSEEQKREEYWQAVLENPDEHTAKKEHGIEYILPKYIEDAAQIPHFNLLQARLIISNEMLLNPDKVIIYKYSGYDSGNPVGKSILDRYEKELKKVVEDWCKNLQSRS